MSEGRDFLTQRSRRGKYRNTMVPHFCEIHPDRQLDGKIQMPHIPEFSSPQSSGGTGIGVAMGAQEC
jgi:hypothetical protein